MKRNGQGQIKTCRRKQHVKTDGMKGISNLFCGIFAVGGNYNLTRDIQIAFNRNVRCYFFTKTHLPVTSRQKPVVYR